MNNINFNIHEPVYVAASTVNEEELFYARSKQIKSMD